MLVCRESKNGRTIIKVGNVEFGGSTLVVIAGPCAVESEEQILTAALAVREAGGNVLRGGAYKPGTSPYPFQGLKEEGLKYLNEAGRIVELPIVTEVINEKTLGYALKYVDIVQIGARNMQNFSLLKAVGQANIPVILKRGYSATINEWLNAAEYIMAEGNDKVIFCERGISSFETATRYTLDISAVPVIKSKSHLPIIVDPSCSSCVNKYIIPLAKAAVAAGADGIMVEMHPKLQDALSDGMQSLDRSQFLELCNQLMAIEKVTKTFC
ncbi:3-deoxy-D-arabinoheptulosonate-7-phosphate synthase [Ruminiclostridium sufflavum DSM 19573]|uniref:3-deoxy-D-arabinoheptulosonate-7-phosphate synthase n=2 Tax=Ruminiclostridium TaxID=1508657 RepID=A0A318XLN6_9FIRM|nr:3-deoxy-D-arabinoheptulosonate-7-phosphate synthase [Ruminiclostridium sufflavum DSM 19573]